MAPDPAADLRDPVRVGGDVLESPVVPGFHEHRAASRRVAWGGERPDVDVRARSGAEGTAGPGPVEGRGGVVIARAESDGPPLVGFGRKGRVVR
ncbi:hypothetical protein GCM10025792_18130 [Pseudonocardia tropica]